MTPTQRSLARLKSQGYFTQVVEKWNPFARIRQDLFGAIDILAVRANMNGCIGIQTTTMGNVQARLTKAAALPAIRAFIMAGNRFEVWGWAKRGLRGKRKMWECKVIPISISELTGDQNEIPDSHQSVSVSVVHQQIPIQERTGCEERAITQV